MMHKLQVLLLVVCVAVGPSLAQITFSRSWVPQGKRSGVAGALMAPEGPAHLGESCYDVYLETLTLLAAKVDDLMRVTHELRDGELRLRNPDAAKQ
ncbi:uncharacterized protein LOC125039265 [Penaeus chinensis]|uniref:uncharacterized protein LOC125039265 n=1 Tax=Penaeus chinensis TaxID=139456 RepID=UPI001FB7D792|nr:uncharacterized protein LOC125039265 [Penaeus chinensis]